MFESLMEPHLYSGVPAPSIAVTCTVIFRQTPSAWTVAPCPEKRVQVLYVYLYVTDPGLVICVNSK